MEQLHYLNCLLYAFANGSLKSTQFAVYYLIDTIDYFCSGNILSLFENMYLEW